VGFVIDEFEIHVYSSNMQINNCGVVILAAGSSSRLGRPKQLLPYKEKKLLQHSIDVALDAAVRTVVVVLGANFSIIKKEINVHSASIVINDNWQEGMASSIRCGVNALMEINPVIDAAIFMVCDQPHVSAALLQNLLTKQKETQLPIVASMYANAVGIPALFHESLFNELLQLKGDVGAKKMMNKFPDLVATIPFPQGETDMDTIEDFQALQDNG